jgi:hypothetical protein
VHSILKGRLMRGIFSMETPHILHKKIYICVQNNTVYIHKICLVPWLRQTASYPDPVGRPKTKCQIIDLVIVLIIQTAVYPVLLDWQAQWKVVFKLGKRKDVTPTPQWIRQTAVYSSLDWQAQ